MEPAVKLVTGTEGQQYANRLLGKVAVWKDNAILLLDPSAILYFTVANKRVAVHTVAGTYESGSSLDELEKRLCDSGFFRSHKSFVVNLEHVEKIVPWFNSTYMMKLQGEAGQIPVSRHYVKSLRSLLDI